MITPQLRFNNESSLTKGYIPIISLLGNNSFAQELTALLFDEKSNIQILSSILSTNDSKTSYVEDVGTARINISEFSTLSE